MARHKSLKGAARLGPTGAFELYLGRGQGSSRASCVNESFTQYVKEYWDFLMSTENERQIGNTTAYKRRTSTGKATVEFHTPFGSIRLIRGDGEFATFIWELPFVGAQDAGDGDTEGVGGDVYEGMDDPDASFGDGAFEAVGEELGGEG